MADHRENPIQATLASFADYWKSLKGDEKGEAQVFCDLLFRISPFFRRSRFVIGA